ncbi:hypothetical protein VM98_06670 [Streptomyces rubellomurinus subsp. indigoferus]|nr:hypothetical protein VM98_06670 [Streptomyces rubellomurinus subsp. indigoferus]
MSAGIPENGVSAGSLAVAWVKAPQSREVGNCVELGALPGGSLAVRNSRDPLGPALIFTRHEAQAFAAGMKDGSFDHLFLD